MNYYGPKEIAEGFRTVRKNTVVIAEEIGEQHYGFRPAEGARSIGETLLHVAVAPRLSYQVHFVDHRDTMDGFDFLGFLGGLIIVEKKPHTKAETIALLKEEGERYAKWLDTLTEEFLGERVKMATGMAGTSHKSRFEMILSTKEHELHHRGQLTVMERLVGITPHFTRQMEARIAEMQKAQASA